MQQRHRRRLLLLGAPVLVMATIAIAPAAGRMPSSLTAVLFLLVLYWSGILLLSVLAAPRSSIVALYQARVNRQPLDLILTWLPVAATFFLAFLPSASQIPLIVWVAIVGIAAVNGLLEELFWRGTFISLFPDSLLCGYIYPSVLFAVWHVALALVPGVRYPQGALALVGGAAALGFAWGWVVWHTRDLRSVSIAHVLTNIFAFGSAVLMNW